MLRRVKLRSAILAGLFFLVPVAQAAKSGASSQKANHLHRLLDQAWESKLRDRPEYATYIGFSGHNHRWTDFSAADIERRRAVAREQLKALRSIDRGRLSPSNQFDLDLYARRLEGQVEGFFFLEDELAITRYDGLQLYVPQVFALAPTASSRDYEDRIARLNGIPALIDQTLALLQKGLAAANAGPDITFR